MTLLFTFRKLILTLLLLGCKCLQNLSWYYNLIPEKIPLLDINDLICTQKNISKAMCTSHGDLTYRILNTFRIDETTTNLS